MENSLQMVELFVLKYSNFLKINLLINPKDNVLIKSIYYTIKLELRKYGKK